MVRKLGIVLFLAGVPACSERVSDQLDFSAQLRLACDQSCGVITECNPANPHYGSMSSCIDGCLTWEPVTEPNQCSSRFMAASRCTSDLTCEEYLEWVDRNEALREDGSYPEGIPCEAEWSAVSSCSPDKLFEEGAP